MRLLRFASTLCLIAAFAACSSPAGSAAPAQIAPSSGPEASTTPIASAPASIGTEPAASSGASAEDTQRIFAGGLAAMRTAGTAHLDVAFAGTFDAKGLGLGPVDLSSLHFAGDLDLANRAASVRLEAPVLMDLTFDVVILGETEYARASIGGNTWTRQAANGSLGVALATLSDATKAAGFDAAIADGRVLLAQNPETVVGGVPAYSVLVTIKIPAAEDLEGFLLGALGTKTGTKTPGRPWPTATATSDLLVTFDLAKDDLRPLGFVATLDLGRTKATVTGTFSKIGAPLTVKAPKGAVDAPNPLNP